MYHLGKKIYKRKNILLLFVLLFALNINVIQAQSSHTPPKERIQPNYLTGEEKRAAEIYDRVLPSAVTIFSLRYVLGDKGIVKQEALGSGVIVSNECHILTAAHVVQNADKITVKTQDGKTREAELIFSEPQADIALLRLKVTDLTLKHARLGNSDSLAVGQRSYVIGNPYGLENSFSVGRISAFRDFGQLYNGTTLVEFIQVDAAINSGNSGGAVFNSKGEVIGISSQIISVSGGFQGLGLAVSINTAKKLLALEDRIWMGFDAIYLGKEELGILQNVKAEGGLLVQNVVPGSPAEKAGLKKGMMPAKILDRDLLLGGDLILQIGNQDACHAECLTNVHERLQNEKLIKIKLIRNGKIVETVVDVSQTKQNFLK